MFFNLTNSMAMNIPVALELMRALTNMGVLLSMVLMCGGTLVSLWSKGGLYEDRVFRRL